MRRTTINRIIGYTGRHKWSIISAFICALLGNTMLIFSPLLVGRAVDHIAGEGKVDFDGLVRLIFILIGIYLISSLLQWLMSILSNIAANKTVRDMRRDAFDKLNRLPLRYFDNVLPGDIISRLTNDIDAVSDGLFQGITQIMSAVIIITGCFFFMLSISPLITVVVVLITPLCFFIASTIARQSRRMFAGQSKTMGELNGYVDEIIGNLKVVKAFGYENRSFETFQEINGRLCEWGEKAQWYSSLTNPTTRLVNNIAYAAVTVIGGLMAVGGGLTVGRIASFITYSNQFAKPINEITSIASNIQSAFASADRIFALIDEKAEEEDKASAVSLKNPEGSITFEHVKFSYQKEVPLIRDLNLDAKKGDMIAIVGPTGAGKTTLVNLLMRFYHIDSGHIMIDGNNIYDITKDSLRRSIGMVLQDSWLFSGTAAENIAYGKKEASREEIENAAKAAKAHGFISRFPNGYDTIIDEDGRNLSEGQKQLITIARVMLMNPSILILDEATSSIDTRTEVLIQKAFKRMMEGRTSFVIAHRLSTIREADSILVLKDGDIIEQGCHNELLARKGFYYTLYNSQFENTDAQ